MTESEALHFQEESGGALSWRAHRCPVSPGRVSEWPHSSFGHDAHEHNMGRVPKRRTTALHRKMEGPAEKVSGNPVKARPGQY